MKIEHLIVQHLFQEPLGNPAGYRHIPSCCRCTAAGWKQCRIYTTRNAVRLNLTKSKSRMMHWLILLLPKPGRSNHLLPSDLESYSILAKQFLNIGKSFPDRRTGVLQKNQEGIYEFTQGNYVHAKLEAAPALLKEKAENEISFSATTSPREKTKAGCWYPAFYCSYL